MSRTREWIKLGILVVGVAGLGVLFAAAVDRPRSSEAQQRSTAAAMLQEDRPAPLPAAQPALDLGNAFAAVAEAVRPTVVYINAETRTEARRAPAVPRGFEEFFGPEFPQPQGPQIRRGQGSGFIISPDGYILTNNHVVEGADRLRVSMLDRRVFDARVVGRDPATDVAVIKIDGTGLPAVSFGDSDSLRIGEWVLAIGNPLGEAFSFTVTAGIVSAKGRVLDGLPIESQYRIQDFIQTDAAINPGNSGGPLVNIRGQVVGINSAIASQTGFYQGYGFAIPMNLARVVAHQLITDGRVRRAILGISITDARPEDAEYVGLDEIRGVVVQDFSGTDSPARRAGLRPGDVIVELDGEPIHYVAQLQQRVGFKRPGDDVRVTVLRSRGERRTFTIRLAEAPAEEPTRVARAEPAESDPAPAHETRLGIALRPLTEETAARTARIGAENAGLAVTRVEIDSPARDQLIPWSGQTPGDIITHAADQRVRSMDEFERVLRGVEAGEIVSLRIYNPTVPRPSGGTRVVRVRVPR